MRAKTAGQKKKCQREPSSPDILVKFESDIKSDYSARIVEMESKKSIVLINMKCACKARKIAIEGGRSHLAGITEYHSYITCNKH